jgi:Transposase DDE domain group 1
VGRAAARRCSNGGETISFAPKPVRTSATSASGAPSATRPTSSLNGRRQRTARSRGKHDDAGKSRPPRPKCERCDSVLAHPISRAPRRHALGFPRTCYGRLSAGRRSRARSARIKEGKGAIKWTRLSCRTFAANAVRLQLHALAYNLANFMRALAMPKTAEPWSLTSLREKLIKIGAKVVSHGRYTTFQMAEVAVPRQMFQEILMLIAQLRAPPAPT